MAGTTDFVKKMASSAKEIADTVMDKAEDAFEVISEKGEVLKDKASEAIREHQSEHLKLARDLYDMIGAGKTPEAFEKYYDDDVVMVELGEAPRVGKDVNRKAGEQWRATVKEMHGGGVTNITSNEGAGVTMVESWVDITFQDGNRVTWEQVAVQKWEDGKIVHEKFYHK